MWCVHGYIDPRCSNTSARNSKSVQWIREWFNVLWDAFDGRSTSICIYVWDTHQLDLIVARERWNHNRPKLRWVERLAPPAPAHKKKNNKRTKICSKSSSDGDIVVKWQSPWTYFIIPRPHYGNVKEWNHKFHFNLGSRRGATEPNSFLIYTRSHDSFTRRTYWWLPTAAAATRLAILRCGRNSVAALQASNGAQWDREKESEEGRVNCVHMFDGTVWVLPSEIHDARWQDQVYVNACNPKKLTSLTSTQWHFYLNH